jgi:hypothetical protein
MLFDGVYRKVLAVLGSQFEVSIGVIQNNNKDKNRNNNNYYYYSK